MNSIDTATRVADSVVEGEPDQPEQSDQLGERIRGMRRARALTLVQLAEAADLSHPFLSQLERGLARPSMASLERIARALGTSQVELLSVDVARLSADRVAPVSVVRAGEGTDGPYSEGTARVLADGARPFHPLEYSSDNIEFGDSFSHVEDEWVYLVEGHVEFDLGEHGRALLEPGDALYLVGGTPHRVRSIDGERFRMIVVKEHPARLGIEPL